MWLVGVGGIYGCGFKEIYRFPHTTYPYSSCICTFLQQRPYYFFHFVKIIYNYYTAIIVDIGRSISFKNVAFVSKETS